ncbi:hypothetical protein F4678DRAFT_428542 [Xylaria arbuscula]|nr:hypothetical protein F4678DRAFT_428542 [Xylaria arbuscula]
MAYLAILRYPPSYTPPGYIIHYSYLLGSAARACKLTRHAFVRGHIPRQWIPVPILCTSYVCELSSVYLPLFPPLHLQAIFPLLVHVHRASLSFLFVSVGTYLPNISIATDFDSHLFLAPRKKVWLFSASAPILVLLEVYSVYSFIRC